jgi:hypothetical protein
MSSEESNSNPDPSSNSESTSTSNSEDSSITERTEEQIIAARRTTERTIPIPRELANPRPPPPGEELMNERQWAERLQARLGQAMSQLFGNLMTPVGSGATAQPFTIPRLVDPVEVTKEDIEQVDGILGKVEHHIMEQTRRLLRVEIRENLLNAANLPRLRELIRSGKKIKFVRKRTQDRDRSHDPLFITFGEGIEEGDEIEEFLIAR